MHPEIESSLKEITRQRMVNHITGCDQYQRAAEEGIINFDDIYLHSLFGAAYHIELTKLREVERGEPLTRYELIRENLSSARKYALEIAGALSGEEIENPESRKLGEVRQRAYTLTSELYHQKARKIKKRLDEIERRVEDYEFRDIGNSQL